MKDQYMKKEDHTPEERAGIAHYLEVLAHKNMPLDVSNAVAAIRECTCWPALVCD